MNRQDGKYRKKIYASQFKDVSDEQVIFDLFLLASVKYNSNTRGVKWLEVKLQDNTGFISGRIWADKIRSEYETMAGKPVFVKGTVNYYAGRPEITIEMLRVVKDGEFDLSEFCRMVEPAAVSKYIDLMRSMVSKIENGLLRDFVGHILTEETLQEMSTLPVDLHGHHNYRGGLLEHTFEVSWGAFFQTQATGPVRRYPVNKDLVSAGALLHDIDVIGRIMHNGYGYREKAFHGLIGSLPLYDILTAARAEAKLPDNLFAHLLHIIEASHETGVAKTAEAMAVRSANLLSIEYNRLEDTLWSCKTESGDCVWSRTMEREVYRFGKEKQDGDTDTPENSEAH